MTSHLYKERQDRSIKVQTIESSPSFSSMPPSCQAGTMRSPSLADSTSDEHFPSQTRPPFPPHALSWRGVGEGCSAPCLELHGLAPRQQARHHHLDLSRPYPLARRGRGVIWVKAGPEATGGHSFVARRDLTLVISCNTRYY
jgi:hypothetical protein